MTTLSVRFDRGDIAFIIIAGAMVGFCSSIFIDTHYSSRLPGVVHDPWSRWVLLCPRSGEQIIFNTLDLAFLYSGLARRKSALSLIWAVSCAGSVVIFQWFFWGYSLAFSATATNGFIGNLRNFGLRNVLGEPSPGSPLIPELLYSFYQMEFACVTAGILMGAIAERGRVFPAMIFCFIWMTLVYCPIACWVWSTHGWAFRWGVLDYAGK